MSRSFNVCKTYPAGLDVASLRADPYLTWARVGADACIDGLAQDFRGINTSVSGEPPSRGWHSVLG